jgi:hypothetical protein
VKLTVEQEFNIIAFAEQVKALTVEQSRDLLVEIYRQNLAKENAYKELLKQHMGVI